MGRFSVYAFGDRWAVRGGVSNDGFGDSVWPTREAAEAAAADGRQRAEDQQRRAAAREAAEAAERAADAERRDLDGYLDGASPLTVGRAVKTLSRPVRYAGGPVQSRRDAIRRLVAGGWRVQGDRLVSPRDTWLDAGQVTRTGLGYAAYLQSRIAGRDD